MKKLYFKFLFLNLFLVFGSNGAIAQNSHFHMRGYFGLTSNTVLRSSIDNLVPIDNFSFVSGISFRDLLWVDDNFSISSSLEFRGRGYLYSGLFRTEPNLIMDDFGNLQTRILMLIGYEYVIFNRSDESPNNLAFNFGFGLSFLRTLKGSQGIEISLRWTSTPRAFDKNRNAPSGFGSYTDHLPVQSLELIFSLPIFSRISWSE